MNPTYGFVFVLFFSPTTTTTTTTIVTNIVTTIATTIATTNATINATTIVTTNLPSLDQEEIIVFKDRFKNN